MKIPNCRVLILGCISAVLSLTCAAVAAEDTRLPVRKVVLYKNGMGYFQHQGTVDGDARIEIPLSSSQLDDILKSLTVLDLGNGRISEITYNSTAALSRQLDELPIDLRTVQGILSFLNQLRGAELEIETPRGTLQGRLLTAEIRNRTTGNAQTEQVIQLSIFEPGGTLKALDLDSLGGIRFTDPNLAAEVERFLGLLNQNSQRDVRILGIRTAGSGNRDLFVSYTSESPIWKATYRLVLSPGRPSLIQGWAIVDNTTPLNWTDVELSLVSGAPVSFIQNLSQPIYGTRPFVPVSQGIQISPEVHGGALSVPADEMKEKAAFEMRDSSMAPRARMMESEAPMAMMAPAAAPLEVGDVMRQSRQPVAEARTAGEQFEYKLPGRITIGKNESALLPILQSELGIEKVSVYSRKNGLKNPRLAIWVRNDTGLTLDGGAFTVIDTNTFAGEGLFDTVQPGERRLLSYALDLGVEVDTESESTPRKVERVVVNRGNLILHRQQVEQFKYTVRNNADSNRSVIVEHPARDEWQLSGEAKPVETSADEHRFQVSVSPQTTETLIVEEKRPIETVYVLSTITTEQIAFWVRSKSISGDIENALRSITSKKEEIAQVDRQITSLRQNEETIFRDQQRIRENLNRLSRTPEESALRQRYIDQLTSQEDQLAQIRSQQADLEQKRMSLQNELDSQIGRLSYDQTI
ncbi:MAG: hypothetical protein JSU96_16850 [Acidobacteriota bacterium]|nr:MAG: hypothetical protein JSU96_16850 [Acidobacteriota bacterium]